MGLPLIQTLSSPSLSILHVEIEGGGAATNISLQSLHQLCAFLRRAKHSLRMLQLQVRNRNLTEREARMVLQACRKANILSVDIDLHFEAWVPQDGFADYSFLTEEFRGARIATVTHRTVVFVWLDLHAIDTFISEFLKTPDVDMVGVCPELALACPRQQIILLRRKLDTPLDSLRTCRFLYQIFGLILSCSGNGIP